MISIKNQVFTEKAIKLLQKNQYTFDINPKFTKSEMKKWIESFFNVKVKSVNTHRYLNNKRKRTVVVEHYKRMIVTVDSNYSIPNFLEKEN
jgi:large subunit ribosomal protein L23|uniref:Ribosomal protein L23 n=1 Tax=Equisetum arvense TaxID=3258 RepID=E3T2Q3_EQUAR|nr:ribosomal protein L23 [Equisetum arvense]ADA63541.1 ribosomal protein L23 [Equisetum arvense]AEV58381.1 ribosomal protein L23 [Equisetum arvense]